MSMHGANGKGKRKQKGHLAFQVPFLHVLARSHENGTNGGLTFKVKTNKGATYRCYFTSAIAVTSDAVCTKIGAKDEAKNAKTEKAAKKAGKNQSQSSDCNALLRAAGRC